MKILSKVSLVVTFTLALAAAFQIIPPDARAQSSYFTSRGCVNCHSAPVSATCNGCHHHGNVSLRATADKTSYAPGDTVTVTLTGGSRSGWIGARLYDQTGAEIARSTGNQSGMGGATTFPATLSAPAPGTAGTYTWKMAYFGNNNGTGSGDVHSEAPVNVSITVAAAVDAVPPTVTSFTLPPTATSLTVPVTALTATDNVAVTGYLITKSTTTPSASASGWSTTPPATVTAVAGSNTFYAWAKDAAGNVSLSRSATVVVTISTADTTPPTLTVSTLSNGSYTNTETLNISGTARDAGGLQSVTVNGQPVTVNADGSFSTAITLVVGENTITVVATDMAGNKTTISRTITYDPTAPVLDITTPADNSTTVDSFITVSGTVNENSTVVISVNGGTPRSAAMTGTSFSATVNLIPGINTIDIVATDLAGNTTSAKRTVTSSAPASQLTLAVTNPPQDVTTGNSRMTIRGTVQDASGRVTATVSVNGRVYPLWVSRDGSFSKQISFAASGTYVIIVTATDVSGNSATVTRNVIYSPSRHDSDHHRDSRSSTGSRDDD